MALTATVYTIDLDITDHDRGVYDSLALRVARHPSESDEYLVTRVLAYALEYVEGLAFSSGGLSSPEEPALAVRDLTGALRTWIEVGWPDADRLHKAAKAAARVVVYPHKDPAQWLRRLAGAAIHRGAAIEVRSIDLALIEALVARLDRRTAWSVAVSGQEVFVSVGEATLSGGMSVTTLR
ncbi:hypothetical protein TBR22_A23380 [Luteitalea sp. TBR-22]|uniref:YaeQ family protein n=1 Tax=Luteitalea sp. TBR-22 TaxID=2802971 RepID=UPI001AF043E1|nr:YaeQ family protein [Luteitalea sp. TBR-22]BCS33112.1 hypothetical protein TBR22_A23380 [Luteitalea sp. TBR-22]